MQTHTSQEFLKTQRYVPIPIIIIPLEHVRHPFQNNTALHKQVEAHAIIAALVISRIQQIHKSGGKPVAKCNQRFRILIEGYVAALVLVKAIEKCAPRSEETPKTTTNMSDLTINMTTMEAERTRIPQNLYSHLYPHQTSVSSFLPYADQNS